MGNKHATKKFKCKSCEETFAFSWQLKYHSKFCGKVELKCATCNSCYTKPMSLLMHCKRKLHLPPADLQFKLRKNTKIQLNSTFMFLLPIQVLVKNVAQESGQTSLISNTTINAGDPITQSCSNQAISSTQRLLNSPPIQPTKCSEKLEIDKPNEVEKKSMECQTVRKKNRSKAKHSSKSIETQTTHSSFEATRVEPEEKQMSNMNTKCSFTQTLMDDFEQSDFLVKDTFLASAIPNLDQSAQTDFNCPRDPFESYITTETQTHSSMVNFGNDGFGLVTPENHSEFQFLDFSDIETQTIWNYDRTTQTEDARERNDWLLNLETDSTD